MTWDGEKESIHHRNESSFSNFVNAKGGVLGDTRVLFRYLFFITMGLALERDCLWAGGIVVPSKNTLTSDPFFLNGDDKVEHRHFGISQGSYKGFLNYNIIKKVGITSFCWRLIDS